MSDVDRLSDTEKGILLSWFLYYMPSGMGAEPEPTKATRANIMREYPRIYNKLYGREIVKVVRCEDGSLI